MTVSSGDKWTLLEAERSGTLFDIEFGREYIDQLGLLNPYNLLPLICAWYARGSLLEEDANQLISQWWSPGGYAHHIDGWAAADWVDLFEYAGFVTDDPEVPLPQHPLTIWRGGVPGAARGVSWSTDRAVGEYFAMRSVWKAGRAELWQTTIAPQYVLGFFTSCDEAEVVIDPSGLGEIVTVATYTGEQDAHNAHEWMEVTVVEGPSGIAYTQR
jgi:hypothetical protein